MDYDSSVNTKHDITSYERKEMLCCNDIASDYIREIFDCNVLYQAYLKARKGSQWKPQVQKFGTYYLLDICKISYELEHYTYMLKPTSNFILNERGKTRYITGEQIQDRIVNHAACDEILNPIMEQYLIYDNAASIRGKGIDFTRRRLIVHLRKYYKEYGNEGYILLIDFSKYYDNIRHKILYSLIKKHVSDNHALWVLRKALERARVDVSYMSNEEYSNCLNGVFNSLDYNASVPYKQRTGQKYMDKHLDIGNQIAQTAGVSYRIVPDNFAKIKKRCKYYAGYMDDTYNINISKEFLLEFLKEYIEICNLLGITVNTKKTRICKLSSQWRFLQVQYSLTESGRIIQKINPKRLTCMRRKMRKIAPKMFKKEFDDFYNSWFKAHYKLMSDRQRENLDNLHKELRRMCKCHTQSH